jgi:DinB family protein
VSDGDLRAQLLLTLREAAERERPLYELVDSPAPEREAWTVKDHIAHLAAWRREACDLLAAVQRGEHGRKVPDLDADNAAKFGRHRDWAAQRVLAEAEASYAAFVEAVESCPAETLAGTRPGTDARVWAWVLGNGHEHVAEHLTMLALESGDTGGADAVQMWAHRVGAAVPGNSARSDYNLGCYFARGGRREEAVPYLRSALDSDAGLREWAKEDPDLASVRELVAT